MIELTNTFSTTEYMATCHCTKGAVWLIWDICKKDRHPSCVTIKDA